MYSKEVAGDFALFRTGPDGTGARRLTQVDGDALNPDWSPDGRRIVFEIDHKNATPDPYCSIAVMDADGAGSPISRQDTGIATTSRPSRPTADASSSCTSTRIATPSASRP